MSSHANSLDFCYSLQNHTPLLRYMWFHRQTNHTKHFKENNQKTTKSNNSVNTHDRVMFHVLCNASDLQLSKMKSFLHKENSKEQQP